MQGVEESGFGESATSGEDALRAAEAAVQEGLNEEAAAVSAVEGSLHLELAELKDRHARLAAEFDNYRKRVLRERAELGVQSQAVLLSKLLDAFDDLERLSASDAATTPLEAVRGALDAAQKKLAKELTAIGLERIDPAGAAFDPARHEAVSVLPPPAPERDHTVSATFQAGYALKGVLIRPARVQVFSSEGHA